MRRYSLGVLLALLFAGLALAQDEVNIHVVQRGENLFRIALGYGLTTEELAAYNGIVDPTNILVGQRLLIPGDAADARVPQRHVVQPGETLMSIAAAYGIASDDLIGFNTLANPDDLVIGTELLLSAPVTTPTAAPPTDTAQPATEIASTGAIPPAVSFSEPESFFHVVQPGETLFRIATSYGLTVNDLATANTIADPTTIYAGQQLVIPGLDAPSVAVELPAPLGALRVFPLVFVEGRTGRITVETVIPATVTGTLLNRDLRFIESEDRLRHRAVLGVPVYTPPGVYTLTLSATGTDGTATPFAASVQVVAGPYGSEFINIDPTRPDLLNAAGEEAELMLIENVTTRFNAERYFDGAFGLPAAAAMTSPFGTRRSYNGSGFDRFHSGADFAGAPGSPILAPAPGRVVLVDTLNIRGGATVIDHGWGVYTGYWHQSAQNVQLGEFVETGQVIGQIGSSGRVTGAHLHWELWVNGVPVDPMQWVQQEFY